MGQRGKKEKGKEEAQAEEWERRWRRRIRRRREKKKELDIEKRKYNKEGIEIASKETQK